MGQSTSKVVPFVIGFVCCALTARLLPTVPAEAVGPTSFAAPRAADVVARVGKCVVNLETYSPKTSPSSAGALPQILGLAPVRTEDPNSVASGVIISARGYILTNNHVVEDAGSIRARLSDGRELDARLVGRDNVSDLAVLKIPARDLSAAPLADSRRARPGDAVLAIGNPLGFENSVSVGIVSANRRGPFRVDGKVLGDMLQTDAAINQGNSGGGLFSASGQLLGINSAIMVARGAGGSIGIGFAIPAHRFQPIAEQLIASGRIHRPWLGIRFHSNAPALITHPRSGNGVPVEGVVVDSPAARAGLKPADVLRRLGACRITAPEDIYEFTETYAPGETVPVKILRSGKVLTLRMTLAERPGREG